MSRCRSCPAYGCGAFGVHCSGDYGVEECSDTLQELYNATANELHRLKDQMSGATDKGIKKALTVWCPELNHIMLQEGGEDRTRILVVEPTRKPEVREISGTLESMQEIVGGLIQALYPFKEPVALVSNDEGKFLGLPMNRALRDEEGKLYDILSGTFFICGISGDDFTSLTEEQLQLFQRIFAIPELFIQFNERLVVLPMDEEA